jgi:hypothetical protein
MNAPDKLLKVPLTAGVFVLRSPPAKARASRRRAAMALLTVLRRAKPVRGAKTGRAYLKETRAARYAR